MTREEENRKLAEWLGYRLFENNPDDLIKHPSRRWWRIEFNDEVYTSGAYDPPQWPDFFTSEEASALLIDKLLATLSCKQILLDAETCFSDQPRELNECEQDHEACIFAHLHIYIHGTDRKAAIALAALKLIDMSEEPKR